MTPSEAAAVSGSDAAGRQGALPAGGKALRENLLVQFSVVSLVVMASIAVLVSIVLANKIRSDAVADLVDEAVDASTDRLLGVITHAGLETHMTGERYDGSTSSCSSP